MIFKCQIFIILITTTFNVYCQMTPFFDGDREYIGCGMAFSANKVVFDLGTQFTMKYFFDNTGVSMHLLPYAGIGIQTKFSKNWDIKESIGMMAESFVYFGNNDRSNEPIFNFPFFRATVELIYQKSPMPLGLSVEYVLSDKQVMEVKPKVTVYLKNIHHR
jgi:hypothetical protein